MGERAAIEGEVAREVVEVEEVLDAAVAVAEHHHRLELLRDDGLARIGEDLGCGEVEEGRVRARLRRGPDGVAEAHVDLKVQAGCAAAGRQRRARAGVFILGADRFDGNLLAVEADRVWRHWRRGDGAQVFPDGVERAVAPAQQVEVAGRAVGLV